MKCPKCHYLSFDPEPRCRNCGYDLELSDDLALKTDEGAVEGPLADLSLRADDAPKRAPITLELIHLAEPEPEAADPPPPAAILPPPPRSPSPAASRVKPPATTSELPLFVKNIPPDRPAGSDDDAMVSVPAARPPLGVRRSSPEPARARPRPSAATPDPTRLGPLDRDLLDGLQRAERHEKSAARPPAHRPAAGADDETSGEDASVGARLGAAALDGLLLGGIGSVVVFATLRLCGLDAAQITALPPVPMAGFFLLVTVGYLLMFTIAGGQTLGKMVMGIRVVSGPSHEHGQALTIRQAAYRELLSVPSVFALGAGYVPALLGRGPALHDRLAETRVVRA